MKCAFIDQLVMLAELKIKPGQVEAFLEYAVSNLAICRSYPGNIAFDILIDESRPDVVRFYEVWESAEVQQRYLAWRIQSGDLTKLLGYLADPPKFTALRGIAA
jgi:quinol monooxygenase YgiN